jgi:hypothetical protein
MSGLGNIQVKGSNPQFGAVVVILGRPDMPLIPKEQGQWWAPTKRTVRFLSELTINEQRNTKQRSWP